MRWPGWWIFLAGWASWFELWRGGNPGQGQLWETGFTEGRANQSGGRDKGRLYWAVVTAAKLNTRTKHNYHQIDLP
jgi:hypothetical protein